MGVQREKYQLDYQYVTLNSRAVLLPPLLGGERQGRGGRFLVSLNPGFLPGPI